MYIFGSHTHRSAKASSFVFDLRTCEGFVLRTCCQIRGGQIQCRSTIFSSSARRLQLYPGTAVHSEPAVSQPYGCTQLATVPLLLNGGSFSKASVPPVFLEDENIFQKSATMVVILRQFRLLVQPSWPIFEKCFHLQEKGGVLIFPRVCMMCCMGRISHTNLKIVW